MTEPSDSFKPTDPSDPFNQSETTDPVDPTESGQASLEQTAADQTAADQTAADQAAADQAAGELTGDGSIPGDPANGQPGRQLSMGPAGSADPGADPIDGPSVWDELVGQQPAVAVLRRALGGGPSGRATTHAWLITGPPGSGRSNAARAFAAALRCERNHPDQRGCGHCNGCRTALNGASPDVTLVTTEHLSIKVDEIRELVRKAAMSPVAGAYQVLIVQDADRLTEQAADALLKSLEEPPERTVWLLCAPTVEDVVPTIRSRCRLLVLRTPPADAVAAMLQDTDGVDPQIAQFSATASQGHIGRARALARYEEVRQARRRVLSLPNRLDGVANAIQAAGELVAEATEEAKSTSTNLDAQEKAELEEAFAMGATSVGAKGSKGSKGAAGGVGRRPKNRTLDAAKKDLEERQKVRAKRLQRDVLDRALLDLQSYYRDVLMVRMRGPQAELINSDLRAELVDRAERARPGRVLRQIDAIAAARTALEENVAPQLALEQMTLALRSAIVDNDGSPSVILS